MNCRDIEPLIYLVRDGELTEKEKSMVSEHILTCSRCRELVQSVKTMTSVVLKADYDHDIQVDKNFYIDLLTKKTSRPGRSYQFIIVKAAAACILFILGYTFVMQESSFIRNRSDLQARLQQEDRGFSDCIRELKRKIHYQSMTAFARTDTLPVNLISEEALTAYVKENCGYNSSDIRALKKLLIQSGLSD
jgi:hypothetical protein